MSAARGVRPRSRMWRITAAVASVLTAAVVHLVAQAGMMLRWEGWDGNAFRSYFWSDQLAYLAIATNAAEGDLSSVEPLTGTGTIYYPRAYYLLLGSAAHLTGTSAATMWTALGLLVQVLLVVMVGGTCVLLTRRWWAGLAGFTPFLLGTFSWLGGEWMTLLGSHAVLWGPFGVLYTLNGESVALGVAGICGLALLLVGAGRVPARLRWPVAVAACLLVGLLASVQTYSFLASVFLLAACTAAVGLARAPSRVLIGLTAGLLLVVLVAGPAVASAFSPLAALAAGLLPAAPGLWALARATRWRLLWCAAAVVAGATPQVLSTVVGVAGGDAFLLYRGSSSQDLGVPWATGLACAAAVIPAMVVVAVLGVRRRRVLWVAVPAASAVVWALLASNDRWGANQEPYRFWLDIYVLVAVLLVPLAAWAVVEVAGGGAPVPVPADRPEAPPSAASSAGRDVPPPVLPLSRRGRTAALVALAVAVAVAASSGADWVRFRRAAAAGGYLQLSTEQYRAVAGLADESDGGLLLTDTCLDPLYVKAVWGGPVTYFNRGLAWPDNVLAVEVTLASRSAGYVDMSAAAEAGVRWAVTSSLCTPGLVLPDEAVAVDAVDFDADAWADAGTVTLWRLPATG